MNSSLFSQEKKELTQDCLENLIYIDYLENDPDLAFSLWKNAYKTCPKSRKSLYINGVKFYEKLISRTNDSVLKEAYLDTLFSILDQRIVYFKQEGFVRGIKGIKLLKYYPNESQKAFEELNQSLLLSGDHTDPSTVVYLMITTINMEKKGLKTASDILDLFGRLSSICSFHLDDANYKKAQAKIESLTTPYINCETLVSITQKNLETNKEDANWLNQTILLFKSKKCYESLVFEEVLTLHYHLNPSSKSAELLAKLSLVKKDFSTAIEWMNKALNLAEKLEEKASFNYQIAQIYIYSNQYEKVKSFALKAIQLQSNWGDPYLLIGDAYVYSATKCNDNKMGKWGAYWAATDQYEKAKLVDKMVTIKANEKIQRNVQQYPSVTDLHWFSPIKEGDSYLVKCWINETATVRVR